MALSVRPGVVFSEPVDPATLTVGMRLVTGGLVVSGRIELREPWLAELVPDAPLTPLTTYRMELTRDVRDLDGDPLEDAVTAEFTTHAGPPVSLSRMRIAFVSSRDGFDRIYLVNGDGSGLVPLTAGTGPAWSWDDQRIAFHRNSPAGPVIGIINADGTGERVIGPGANPAWSPDGRLAFVSSREDDGGIAVMNADGTGYTLLLSHDFTYPGCKPPTSIYAWWGDCVTDPQWSPDGRRIAFFSGDVGYTGAQVYVMNADGSPPIQLVPDRSGNARQPTWAPDGSRLAFVWGGLRSSITAFSLDGSDTFTTLSYGVDPSWSPDGRWIAYLDDAGPLRIAATNVVTGEPYGQLDSRSAPAREPGLLRLQCGMGATILTATGISTSGSGASARPARLVPGGRVARMWKRVLFGGALLVAGAVAHQGRREAVPEQPAPAPAASDLAAAGARADSIRDEIARTLRLASAAELDSTRAPLLTSARGLARAYAAAWHDSFLVRRVAGFERRRTPAERRSAAADSLWRGAGR